MFEDLQSTFSNSLNGLRQRLRPGEENGDHKFGTFYGVFVPTVLTILGAIMYLREGWVVGNAGLGGAILIILLAHIITITTGLAVSSIATNIRVGAGGAFAIISQSLGLEVGGSVGIPLYLAQTVSITLYVLAFTEGWARIFPGHPFAVVALLTLAVVFAIAYISAKAASRTQLLILAVVGLSLFSIFLGSFAILGQAGMTHEPVLWGQFPTAGFWGVFAVFFPAVTGIMVGISMSGSLRNPRQSIPQGTMSSIGLTMVIYLLLAYWLARVATPEELVANTTIMVDKAAFGWLVLAGLLGATFSSALGSLVAAPRVMQALAQHNILPFGQRLAKATASGEPRQALIVTGVIALFSLMIALASGGLDAIAPLITMFFLLTYATLNGVVLIEQTLNMVSFRPVFQIPRLVPFTGLVFCLFVMFLVNPTFSLISVALMLLIYGFLLRRHLDAPFSDVRSGLFLALAEWAAQRVSRMPAAPERTWRPSLLAPVTSTHMLTGSYRFLRAVAAPKGAVFAIGIHRPEERERVEGVLALSQAFMNDGIFSRATLFEHDDFLEGVKATIALMRSAFFRPNILFLPLSTTNDSRPALAQLLNAELAQKMGIILLARHPIIELGREQLINVWVREQGPRWELGLRLANLDLAVLLAYQLQQNWSGQIQLCMAVPDETTRQHAEQFCQELITLARLPRNTRIMVAEGAFDAVLARTPPGDLNMFGLQRQADLTFIDRIVATVDASCIFVRDSGDESALA